MATSDVEIVNVALSLLGANAIADLGDNTTEAKLASRFYASCRDSVLRAHPWNFAMTRIALPLLSATPVYGWAYQFELPNDCLRVIAVNDDEECGWPGDIFKVEAGMLMSNSSSAKARYIAQITDPVQFDALFAQALSYQLAAVMAYPVTGSQSVTQNMLTLYSQVIGEARTIDGQEGSPDIVNDYTLLAVRR